MQELLNEFINIDKIPMFEIQGSDDEFYYDYIVADDKGLRMNNFNNTFVAWDEYFSLDEHLEQLLELFTDEVEKDITC